MKTKNKRRRVLADFKIQGILCLRVIAYWLVCQATFAATILAFVALEGQGTDEPSGSLTRFLVPAFCIGAFILPIALFDMLCLSNRFAGPMFSFRRRLRELAESGSCQKIHFRRGDYYQDFAGNFNKLIDKIASQESAADVEQQPQMTNGARELQESMGE